MLGAKVSATQLYDSLENRLGLARAAKICQRLAETNLRANVLGALRGLGGIEHARYRAEGLLTMR